MSVRFFSVIIPTYGFRPELSRCLVALFGQEGFESLVEEVLVCHQGPSAAEVQGAIERSVSIGRRRNVRFLEVPEPFALTRTRNFAARTAKGKVLVFLDDDTVVSEGFLGNLYDFYVSHEDAGAVGSNVQSVDCRTLSLPYIAFAKVFGLTRPTRDKCDFLASTENTFAFPLTRPICGGWLSGCGFSFWRSNFGSVRFDEKLSRYSFKEDLDFSFRLRRALKRKQKEMYVVPEVRVEHLQASGFRVTGTAISVMKEYYSWYLFFKDFFYLEDAVGRKLFNLFFFFWSRLGKLTLKVAEAVRYQQPSILLSSLQSLVVSLGHLRKIMLLDVGYVNKWL